MGTSTAAHTIPSMEVENRRLLESRYLKRIYRDLETYQLSWHQQKYRHPTVPNTTSFQKKGQAGRLLAGFGRWFYIESTVSILQITIYGVCKRSDLFILTLGNCVLCIPTTFPEIVRVRKLLNIHYRASIVYGYLGVFYSRVGRVQFSVTYRGGAFDSEIRISPPRSRLFR